MKIRTHLRAGEGDVFIWDCECGCGNGTGNTLGIGDQGQKLHAAAAAGRLEAAENTRGAFCLYHGERIAHRPPLHSCGR